MKISSEDWKAAWFLLLQSLCKYCTHSQRAHTHIYTHKHFWHLSGGEINYIDHRAWLSPTGCPRCAALQRWNIISVLVLEAFWLPPNTFFKQTIMEENITPFQGVLGVLLLSCMWWRSTHNANIVFLYLEFSIPTMKAKCSSLGICC